MTAAEVIDQVLNHARKYHTVISTKQGAVTLTYHGPNDYELKQSNDMLIMRGKKKVAKIWLESNVYQVPTYTLTEKS